LRRDDGLRGGGNEEQTGHETDENSSSFRGSISSHYVTPVERNLCETLPEERTVSCEAPSAADQKRAWRSLEYPRLYGFATAFTTAISAP
jgi:hypothetical protein